MIRYELRCAADHGFEAWFRNSAGFEEQRSAGELVCPICGDAEIGKAPMAPSLARTRPAVDPVTMLRALRRAVETTCEDVGERFPEEARRIHYGEAAPRGIFGAATKAEAEALADEGIEVAAIPWVPPEDA